MWGEQKNKREKKESSYDEMIGALGHPPHRHFDAAMGNAFPMDLNTRVGKKPA